jgi:hypothetical protein
MMGMSRFEWEKEIPLSNKGIIIVMRKGVIDKTRLKSNPLIYLREDSVVL